MSLKAVTTKIPSLQLPEKLKGTIVERWANYWKGMARDYKGIKNYLVNLHHANNYFYFLDVGVESFKAIKAKPLKSSIYGSIGLFLYGCCVTNPDHRHFIEELQTFEQLVGLVSVETQNPKAVNYLKMLEQSRNNDTLRITSIGFLSFMWLADNASGLSTYDAKCDYLKPEYKTFHTRIVDIGWWNNWWNLNNMLKDYDVNY